MKSNRDASQIIWRSNLRLSAILLTVSATLWGCPQGPVAVEGEEENKPTLLLTSFSTCTEQILPVADLGAADVEPVYLPLEVRVNGLTGSEASALSTVISFEPNGPGACLQSSVIAESGEIQSLRCMNNRSAELQFTGSRRTSDALYCTTPGRFLVTAKTTLKDDANTVIKSNPLEVTCLPPSVFEEACELLEPIEDMGVDMDLSLGDMDMEIELDAEVEPGPPAAWSVSFATDQSSGFDLSVQGSTAAYPKQVSYAFSVLDERGQGIPNVPVKFYLDWPMGGEEYEACLPRCATLDESACQVRDECQWVIEESASDAMGGADGEGESAGEGAGEGAGEAVEMTAGADGEGAPRGACLANDTGDNPAGEDERCEDAGEICQSNYCLPESVSLPLIVEPLDAISDAEGRVIVSLVTRDDPGVFSVRAVAKLEDQAREARSPNFTVWHQIPSQDNLSFRCKSPVVAGFFRRYEPDIDLGTDALGYINYQRPASECVFQNADRFTGRVPDVPVFFMSESGNINQSVISDEEGKATAVWHVGGRSPMDVASNSADANGHNPEDGIVRLIAFTQGEARFIDFASGVNNQDELFSGDRVYSPRSDVVPTHREPFVDMNDDGRWNEGEPYHDTNRNQVWDADVFGRSPSVLLKLQTFDECISRSNPTLATLAGCLGIGTMGRSDENIKSDLDAYVAELTEDNPDTLQATVWTSTTVLSVGMPQGQDGEVTATCQGGGRCSPDPIGESPSGFDIYLAINGSVEFTLSPRDDNYNCVGVEGVELSVSLQGEAGSLLSLRPSLDANIAPIPVGNTVGVLPEQCYDANEPTRPKARQYRFRLSYQPDPENTPDFANAQVNIAIKTPTYLVGDGSDRTRTVVTRIGLVGQ